MARGKRFCSMFLHVALVKKTYCHARITCKKSVTQIIYLGPLPDDQYRLNLRKDPPSKPMEVTSLCSVDRIIYISPLKLGPKSGLCKIRPTGNMAKSFQTFGAPSQTSMINFFSPAKSNFSPSQTCILHILAHCWV